MIVGFCDLLVSGAAAGDPRTADLLEVHKAAREAMATMPGNRQTAPAGTRARTRNDDDSRGGGGPFMSAVLIVDDDARVREILARWLAPDGYETQEAPDAETALDAPGCRRRPTWCSAT